MSPPDDRRLEPRKPADLRGVVVAPGFEAFCTIVDLSPGGMKIRLDRNLVVPSPAVVVELAAGIAHDVETAWRKGLETGLKRRSQASLRGLTPSRLGAARDAWIRAGGR